MNAHCKNKNYRWSGREQDAVLLRSNTVCPKCGATVYLHSRDEMYKQYAQRGKLRTTKSRK